MSLITATGLAKSFGTDDIFSNISLSVPAGAGVEFLLGDHLGSTSLTVNSIGGNPRELRYYPWGDVRWASGTTPTVSRTE
jgi:ABC-type transporter Mla maintaining outer membrane lipid asymmetry ATPase subunit MlaF